MAQNKVQLDISQGSIIGVESKLPNGNPFYSFKGIPYAEPPLGELRFAVTAKLYSVFCEKWFSVWKILSFSLLTTYTQPRLNRVNSSETSYHTLRPLVQILYHTYMISYLVTLKIKYKVISFSVFILSTNWKCDSD